MLDYKLKKLKYEDVYNELNNASPLDISKKLLDYELFEEKSSLEVLKSIYEEFESKESVINSLVEPVFLNICDGIIKHPKLGLAKTGLTATRLVKEIKSFDYSTHNFQNDRVTSKQNLDEHTKKQIDDKGKYNRQEMDNNRKASIAKERFNGNRTGYSDLEINDNGRRKRLYLHQNDESIQKRKAQGKKTTHLTQNADHNIPLKKVFEEFGQSKVLSKEDLKRIGNMDDNFDIISEELNKKKGSKTWSEYLEQNPDEVNKETKNRILKREKEARKKLEREANKTVAKNLIKDPKHIKNITKESGKQAFEDSKYKVLGEVVILIIKPLYYEIKDIFKNGLTNGFDTDSKVEALQLRMQRVKNYVISNLKNTAFSTFEEFIKNFVNLVINGVVNAFVGFLKKVLKIISEGFSAIVEAIKIVSSKEMSAAQKADAVTKLLATTVITFLGFYFEDVILGVLNGTPFEFLKDVFTIIIVGVTSTFVVWALDRIDLFSLKDEKRLARVKEIFEIRIENIKRNTDVFEKSALEVLTKQKLIFLKITDKLSYRIQNNMDVNESIYAVADFMQIELNIKSTDDFLKLLEQEEVLMV